VSLMHCFFGFFLNVLSFSSHFDYFLRSLVQKKDRIEYSHNNAGKDQESKVELFKKRSRLGMFIGALFGTKLDPAGDLVGRRLLLTTYFIFSVLILSLPDNFQVG